MNLGLIFLYCFLAIIQIFILMSLGMNKRILNPTFAKYLNQLIFNFFMPIYAIIEISKVVSIQNFQIFWVVIINCLACLFIGICYFIFLGIVLGLIISYSLDIDIRIKMSYSLVLAFPALGSLPLVLGKVFCYPLGPLDLDPLCIKINGLMLLNFLAYVIICFAFSLPFMNIDRNNAFDIHEKLSYLWHVFLFRNKLKYDFGAFYLIQKFIKKDSEKVFKEFTKLNKLKIDFRNYRYYNYFDYYDEGLVEREKIEKEVISLKKPKLREKEEEKDKALMSYKKLLRNVAEEELDDDKENSDPNLINNKPKNRERDNYNYNTRTHKIKFKQAPYETLHYIPLHEHIINNNQQSVEDHLNNLQPSKSMFECFNFIDIYNEPKKEPKDSDLISKVKSIIQFDRFEPINERTFLPEYLPLITYYNNLFDLIKQNTNIKHHSHIHREQTEIINNLTIEDCPIFPIVEGIFYFNKKTLKSLNDEWKIFKEKCLEQNKIISFKFKPVKTSFIKVLAIAICPPLLGGLLGIILGISNLKEVLFNPLNFYLSTNVVNIIYLLTQTFVPLLFANIGFGIINAKGFHQKMLIRPKEMIISLIFRFVIYPFVGLGAVYFWKYFLGGIINQSKVLRFTLFIPYCLPTGPYILITANLLNFLKEEMGLFQYYHNLFLFVFQTSMMLVYFVIMENNYNSLM